MSLILTATLANTSITCQTTSFTGKLKIETHFFSFFDRTVENGKETVEEWEDNILKRRVVDGTLQLTN